MAWRKAECLKPFSCYKMHCCIYIVLCVVPWLSCICLPFFTVSFLFVVSEYLCPVPVQQWKGAPIRRPAQRSSQNLSGRAAVPAGNHGRRGRVFRKTLFYISALTTYFCWYHNKNLFSYLALSRYLFWLRFCSTGISSSHPVSLSSIHLSPFSSSSSLQVSVSLDLK